MYRRHPPMCHPRCNEEKRYALRRIFFLNEIRGPIPQVSSLMTKSPHSFLSS